MNAVTPVVERGILEMLADPDLVHARARELVELIRQSEKAEAMARDAKASADQAMAAAAAEVARQRELQEINTRKSEHLRDKMAGLEDSITAAALAKADDVKRLGDWEQRLKDEAARLDGIAKHWAELQVQQDEARAAFEARLEAAQAVIERAERIKAASEG